MNFVIQSTFNKSNKLSYLFIAFTIIFTILFHKASIGLNLANMALIILGYWAICFRSSLKRVTIIIPATILLTSSLALAWYGTFDCILWVILSLCLLSHKLYNPHSSILFMETKIFIGNILGPFLRIAEKLRAPKNKMSNSKIFKTSMLVFIPLVFGLIFAAIYSNLNPIFDDIFSDVLDFVDISIIITFAIGFLLAIAFLNPLVSESISKTDHKLSDTFSNSASMEKYNKLDFERKVGVALFSVLNTVLFIFFISDVSFLNTLSLDVNGDYSAYVHQGVGLLIFSIIIASSFILYFFRHVESSSLPNKHILKSMALIWVLLNIAIVLSTVGKNLIYVDHYSLTIKRIGVFIYLLLAFTGLGITLIKIYRNKTNAFLFRGLYWSFFIILGLNTAIDWSTIIARYNIKQHTLHNKPLDIWYLTSLNERVLPTIAHALHEIEFKDADEKAFYVEKLHEKHNKLKQSLKNDWRETNFSDLYTLKCLR